MADRYFCNIALNNDKLSSPYKVPNYSQDHGEMKLVVNTILQLFDYVPQSSMVIAATNQKEMLDEALLRRFDLSISLELPEKEQIEKLINLVLKQEQFDFDKKVPLTKLIESAKGLSYYRIQKKLINAIKRSLFAMKTVKALKPKIDTQLWKDLLEQEKNALAIKIS